MEVRLYRDNKRSRPELDAFWDYLAASVQPVVGLPHDPDQTRQHLSDCLLLLAYRFSSMSAREDYKDRGA
jgi:hypothetical protein